MGNHMCCCGSSGPPKGRRQLPIEEQGQSCSVAGGAFVGFAPAEIGPSGKEMSRDSAWVEMSPRPPGMPAAWHPSLATDAAVFRSSSMVNTLSVFSSLPAAGMADEDVSVPRERDEEHSHVQACLLEAARTDDAPLALQCVADGATLSDMGEALRMASHCGGIDVVRELVAVGLCVNDQSPRSKLAPLQLAAANGHVGVCELLLDALADVEMSIMSGSTPAMISRRLGHSEIADLLDRHATHEEKRQSKSGIDEISGPCRRARVLPRVSPAVSEAVKQVSSGRQQMVPTRRHVGFHAVTT
eukprot:gnl/TRDRNA2_/TRDRNA2_200021_c0_seq1.p1 gnl/TRDRNA2_/TRDRNA2_200021_c0~~gnl/TRDRNA2_/TRDRNA2_200021_c0_seq1.p1  ORF type:complete len:300 (+),score=53.39 gnl/TRDRNA2_/TRDRNA2_200021_c0_seq1:92-991(+)